MYSPWQATFNVNNAEVRKNGHFSGSHQLIVNFSFAINGYAKRSKKREAKLRVKNSNLRYFDAKLRFALLASLRSANYSETEVDN